MTSIKKKKINIKKLYSHEKGLLIIVSAPSGSGKTTILNHIISKIPQTKYSISYTTRTKRPGEKEGKHYHFIDNDAFSKKITQGVFLEWARVYDNCYGTSKKDISKLISKGYDVIMDLDTKGACNVKKLFGNAVLIFLLPPSINELNKRLKSRNSDSPDEIKKRIGMAMNEISHIPEYDYVVINDSLTHAVSAIKSIIISEKKKVSRILK
ncbi:MAG: guanylate kinase [Candidatus Schekmanbacteria bacterium]|nr:guanylate kinase [Candidatus Schekmanbacteria bacterium]